MKSMSNALGKTGRCLVGLDFLVLAETLPSRQRDPARQTETCEYEPCLIFFKLGRFCKTNFDTIFGKVLVRFLPVGYLRYLHAL